MAHPPKFKLKDADEVKRYLERSLEKAATGAVQAAAMHVVEDIQTKIIPEEPRPPVDRGVYRAGWRAQPTQEGAMIVNAVPHAIFIEHGVRAENVKPGKAMITALSAWAQRKGIAGKGKSRQKQANSIAWAIAHSMRRKGIFNREGAKGGGGGGTSMVKRVGGGGLFRKVMRTLRKARKGVLGLFKSKKERPKTESTGGKGLASGGGFRILQRGLQGFEQHLQRELNAALKKVFR